MDQRAPQSAENVLLYKITPEMFNMVNEYHCFDCKLGFLEQDELAVLGCKIILHSICLEEKMNRVGL